MRGKPVLSRPRVTPLNTAQRGSLCKLHFPVSKQSPNAGKKRKASTDQWQQARPSTLRHGTLFSTPAKQHRRSGQCARHGAARCNCAAGARHPPTLSQLRRDAAIVTGHGLVLNAEIMRGNSRQTASGWRMATGMYGFLRRKGGDEHSCHGCILPRHGFLRSRFPIQLVFLQARQSGAPNGKPKTDEDEMTAILGDFTNSGHRQLWRPWIHATRHPPTAR